jgi:hypothetical protein
LDFARVALVFARVAGTPDQPGHAWRLMPQLGCSLQRPTRQAKERNPAAGRQWGDERCPGSKKVRRQRRWLVSVDETSFSPRPAVRRTWAPKDETPILIPAFNWKRMSATALAQRWDSRRSRLFFQLKPDSHNTKSLMAFLPALMRELRAHPFLLLWDGLPAHKSLRTGGEASAA